MGAIVFFVRGQESVSGAYVCMQMFSVMHFWHAGPLQRIPPILLCEYEFLTNVQSRKRPSLPVRKMAITITPRALAFLQFSIAAETSTKFNGRVYQAFYTCMYIYINLCKFTPFHITTLNTMHLILKITYYICHVYSVCEYTDVCILHVRLPAMQTYFIYF